MILSQSFPKHRGVSAIVVLLMMIPVIAIGFFSINICNIQRNEAASQISVDLAATYGGNLIGRTADQNLIRTRAAEIASLNWNVGEMTNAERRRYSERVSVNVELGSTRVNRGNMTFTSGATPVNTIRVSANGPAGVVKYGEPRTSVPVAADATVVATERDVCLVIDRSGSMTFDLETGTWFAKFKGKKEKAKEKLIEDTLKGNAHLWWWGWPHPRESRWSAMMPAVYSLADELEKTRQRELFSIVSYSSAVTENRYGQDFVWKSWSTTASRIECAPTYDYRAAVRALDTRYDSQFPIMGSTNISAGIDLAATVLTGPSARPNAFKTMIVMTDGQYNAGREPWLAAADAWKNHGIEVFAITFSDQGDQASMIKVAEEGHGKHFHAATGRELADIFREIANMPTRAFVE